MTKLFVFAMLTMASCFAFSADTKPLFEALRNSGENFNVVGTICEQVARLNLQKTYPSDQFDIINGIEYSDQDGVMGELDVSVLRKSDSKAVLVAEVKCWNNLAGANQKARAQRQRFLNAIRSNVKLDMKCHDARPCHFTDANFKSVQKFITISQDGGEKFGFDMTLGYSMTEMMNLRHQLIDCQYAGQCASAQ